MLAIKSLRKFILPVLVSVVMVGCGFEAEFADELAQHRDPKVRQPKDPILTQREQKERIENMLSRNPPENSAPRSRRSDRFESQTQSQTLAAEKDAREQALKLDALNELVDGIDQRHREKLEQVRSQLSPQAVAAVDAAITREIDELRGTVSGSLNYHSIEYRLQSLSWLDVLLNPTEIAGTSMLDVLESMVAQQQLIPFLRHHGWGMSGWSWFYYGMVGLYPPPPSWAPPDWFVNNYTSSLKKRNFNLAHYTEPSFLRSASQRMEQVLRQRTEQLIAHDAEVVQWLRDLGYDEVADALPPAQQAQGSNRFQMMRHYLESVTDGKHRRQLKLLVPQVPGENVLTSMLFFVAGAEDGRYHVTSMGELLEVMKITKLTGSQPEFWIDKGDYDYMKEAYDILFESAPGGSATAFHVKQFSVPREALAEAS